jgi:hypothetical protein
VICVNCGTENPDDAATCERCGQPLSMDVSGTEESDQATQVGDGEATAPPSEEASAPPAPAAPPGPVAEAPAAGTATPGPPLEPPGPPPAATPSPPGALPPDRPARTMSAGVTALIAVVAVIALVALVRAVFIHPHHTSTPNPNPTTTTAPSTRPTTPLKPTTPKPKPPPPEPQPERILVSGCQSVRQDLTCVGRGLTQSANAQQFSVMIWIENPVAGQKLVLNYLDPQTGGAMAQPNTYTTTGKLTCSYNGAPAECAFVTFNQAPYQPFETELYVTVDGDPVQFDPPAVLRLA